ncbi:MAG: DUF3489 domain-containing protein [Alphaproteobacteria bacterium]|nr:DUF3489 domain-containing protein [Alphaproteobacteria bacterium]
MSAINLSADITERLLAKGYAETPSDNKQWRIFFQPASMDTRWFVHEGGKVRRGKSVHNSTAITQEARRMLGRYWLEKRGSKAAPEMSAPAAARHRTTKPAPAPQPQTAKDKILTLMQSPGGATTAEMIKASGWQAHSVRAFLSRLRQKHVILTRSSGKLKYYRIITSKKKDNRSNLEDINHRVGYN